MPFSWEFQKCANPACSRQVKIYTRYCCGPCVLAHQGSFEIHEHTFFCDQRDTERGPYVEWP